MKKTEIARKNLEYFELLTQELLENDALARRVPRGASVYFLPDSDPELASLNRKSAVRARRQGKKVVLVRIELIPKTTFVPRLTVERAVAP